jgi:predicted cupin superfamily sugar epimerase
MDGRRLHHNADIRCDASPSNRAAFAIYDDPMTAAEVKQLLHLQPHPREGGWYVRTWEAAEFIASTAGSRRTSTAIYYLLEPETFSEMHVLESDEIFHHYLGGSVEMLQLLADGTAALTVIGKDIAAGEKPQHVVPRGVWQGSRLLSGDWALLGCTVSPGFEFEDYRAAGFEELAAHWPLQRERIRALTRS